ncbi:zinc finger protein Xfin-like [Aedes albopictus]|uniref:C2H2-type domain-containing protein n=1 Tax=Aedes albopictus TaxID=7160 RepID=A0ABM1XM26_AEDAL
MMEEASEHNTAGQHFCGLCRKSVDSVTDCSTSSYRYLVPLHTMFDVFRIPTNCTAPQSLCDGCSDKLHSAYDLYQFMLLPVHRDPPSLSDTDTLNIIESNSSQKPLHPCDTCDLSFEDDLSLQRHQKLEHMKLSAHHYFCQHCTKTFKTKRGLDQHLTYCHKTDDDPFRCDQCFRDFATKTSFINHLAYHVDFLCKFCDHGFLNEVKLLEHVRNNHVDRLFRCKRCTKTEPLRKTLNRHLRSAHNVHQDEFYCGHCSNGSSFDDLVALNDHMQEVHKSPQAIEGDYAELLNEPFFAKDIALELELDKSRLEENKEDFLKQFDLVRSRNSEKSNTLNPNKMILEEFLDEAFENDQVWAKYIEGGEEYLIDNYDFYLEGPTSNKVIFRYKCPQCDAGFMKQVVLTIHLAETHGVACLVCNDCGANFRKLVEYRDHRREHLKDNARFVENIIPEAEEALSLVQQEDKEYTVCEKGTTYVFTCKLCDRTFAKKSNFEKHKCSFYASSSKSEEKGSVLKSNPQLGGDPTLPDSLFCTLCDKKFISISGLKYHLKRHTDIKAFSCVYCSKKFTANSNLNAHIRNKHSEDKSHPCPECEQCFACKDHLSKHIRSRHRQERAFKCPECTKCYFQKSHLNDHVAASHLGYKAFVCELCNTSYSCRGSLRRHLAKSHNR